LEFDIEPAVLETSSIGQVLIVFLCDSHGHKCTLCFT
jgi:hypothetical protein